MSIAIKVQSVSKKFGRRTVLDGVSFEVPVGCVFALLGENGAGKSTLIRGLLGFHQFASGTVEVLGKSPTKQTMELRRLVGYVSDQPGLYEWMTIAEAGWYASGFYPAGYLDRFSQLASDFQLPLDGKIRDLSKGMRAKVALSLAMAFDPQLLVLDEPTSGLDPLVRRAFLESMVDRAAAGQTVFLSSHQIQEVERVADYVAILHAGKLQVVARLDDLKSEVTMIRYSMRDPLLAAPIEFDPTEVLHRDQSGRSFQLLVRGFKPEMQEIMLRDLNLFDFKAVRPNLEELYIGFTQPTSVAEGARPQPRKPVSEVA